MKETYKTGIIGLGLIAYDIDKDQSRKIIWSHVNAYKQNKAFKIEAVSELNEAVLNKTAEEINVSKKYSNYKDMLKNENLEVISICTPISTHAEIIRECLKYPNIKVIFCEKTLTFDYELSKKLVEECKEKNVLLVINHILRWDNRIKQIKEVIDSKTLGNVSSVVAYSNTALHTSASHMIDVLCLLFEDMKVIYGQKQTDFIRKAHGTDDHGGFAFLKNKEIPIFLKSNSNDPLKFVFELDIFFDNGRLKSWDNLEKTKLYEFRCCETKTGSKYMSLEEISDFKQANENQRMCEAVDSIEHYLEYGTIPISTGETSLKSLKIINDILKD